MARTISTRIELSGEAEYKAAVKNINSELRVLKSEMALAESEFQGQANTVEALTKKHDILQRQYSVQASKVAELEKMQQEANKALEAANAEYETQQQLLPEGSAELEKYAKRVDNAQLSSDKYTTQLNNARAELSNMDQSLKQTSGYLDEAKRSTDGCATSIDNFGKKTKEASEGGSLLGSIFTSLDSKLGKLATWSGAAAAIASVARSFDACVKAANEFDYSMAKVQSIARVDNLGEMSDEILALSSTLGVAATDVAEAVYQSISAGVSSADAVDFTGLAIKLSKAGFTDAATAVDVLTTAINAYGLSMDDAEKVADNLIATQNLGKTSVGELASSMGKIIPLASATGVGLDDLSAILADLTSNGQGTAESVTGLKAMLNELSKEGSTVGDVLVNETGQSFTQLMNAGYSLGDVIGVLSGSVGGDTNSFKNLWSSVEAGTTALSVSNTGLEKYDRMLSGMIDSVGGLTEAYEIMADTAEETSARLAVSWENWKISFGESISPAKQKVEELIISILELDCKQREYRKHASERGENNLVSEILRLEQTGGDLNLLMQNYQVLLATLGTEFDVTQYETLDDALLAAKAACEKASPGIFDLSETASELADAAEGVADASDELTEAQQRQQAAIASATEVLSENMQVLMDAYGEAYDAAFSSISGQLGLFDMVEEQAPDARATIDDMIAGLKSQQEYLDKYNENLQKAKDMGVSDSIIDSLSDGSVESAAILDTIVQSSSEKIDELNKEFGKVSEGKQEFSDAVAQMKTDFETDMGAMVEFFNGAVGDMDMYDEALEAGKNTIDGLISGVDNMSPDAVARFKQLAKDALAAYKDEMDINSPSKVMQEAGEYTFEGLIVAADEMRKQVENAFRGVAEAGVSAYWAEIGDDLMPLGLSDDEKSEIISGIDTSTLGGLLAKAIATGDTTLTGMMSQYRTLDELGSALEQRSGMELDELLKAASGSQSSLVDDAAAESVRAASKKASGSKRTSTSSELLETVKDIDRRLSNIEHSVGSGGLFGVLGEQLDAQMGLDFALSTRGDIE